MPSKTRKPKATRALPTIPKELIDQFVIRPMSADAVNAASMAFKKALIERALGAELTHHRAAARTRGPAPGPRPRRKRSRACRQQPKHCTKNMRKFASATIALHVHRHPQTPC